MSIQQNVNQLLTMAGTAAMLNPTLRQKAEERTAARKLESQEKALSEQEKVSVAQNQATRKFQMEFEREHEKDLAEGDPLVQVFREGINEQYEAGKEELRGITAEQEKVARQMFQLRPSAESMSALMRAKAMSRLRSEGMNKVEQKSEFDKFRESLDQDDPFHQLSPQAQKIAYEQYKKGGK